MSGKSELEEQVFFEIKALKLDRPVREYQFALPARKWRFDFAWPERKLALEVEGGTWSKGAHTRGGHFDKDAEKYNEAALLGWAVLRVTTTMIRKGDHVKLLRRALA